MIGVELYPESVLVAPFRLSMFYTSCEARGSLVGLMVGSRLTDRDPWRPAINQVTVECVVVHGVSLPIGPWRDLIRPGDLGWPLAGRVRAGQTIAVYIRNDQAQQRELRAVLVVDGDQGARNTSQVPANVLQPRSRLRR